MSDTMSSTDQSRATGETDQPAEAGRAAQTTPLLFAKRVPLSERQTLQYEGTEIEVDPKPDQFFSDVHTKANIAPVVRR